MVLGNGPNVQFLQGLTLEEIVLFLRMAPVVGIGGGTDVPANAGDLRQAGYRVANQAQHILQSQTGRLKALLYCAM